MVYLFVAFAQPHRIVADACEVPCEAKQLHFSPKHSIVRTVCGNHISIGNQRRVTKHIHVTCVRPNTSAVLPSLSVAFTSIADNDIK